MNIKNIIFSVFAIIGAGIAEALGGWDAALHTLVIVMVVDYITGVLCALVWHRSPKTRDGAFESKASFKGLIRKIGILLCVLVAYRLDLLAGTQLVRTAVILFFIANDGFSIIENLGIMGLPMPSVLKKAFEVLRDKAEASAEQMCVNAAEQEDKCDGADE